jgi:3-phosphoshikimate 1-carboxyvinyltransferase
MNFKIKASSLSGIIESSPSKSHSIRAILFASLADGTSIIRHYLHSPDIEATVNACQQLGAKITVTPESIELDGLNGKPATPDDVIDSGNSGQVLRFITAIAALNNNYAVFTGDYSIRHNRPMQPLIDGLKGLGAFCISTKNDGYAPIVVKGPIRPGITELSGEDSQPISAIIIAAAFLSGTTEIKVQNPGEKPWIDLTLSWLDKIGVKYENHNYAHYIIYGNAKYNSFEYTVPGDFSSILFPVTAALITKSEITLKHVDMKDSQGDKKVIDVLKAMGANIEYDEQEHVLKVSRSEELIGQEIDVNDFIDAVPILAVIGCYAKGQTKITNAAIARSKECDRLACITKELKKMGAKIQEFPDGLLIESSALHGAYVETYHDHRIVMALTVAALNAAGETVVENIDCVTKSYPGFYADMKNLGADILQIS